jgi:hypothetical protein
MSCDESEGPDPNRFRGPCLDEHESVDGAILKCSLTEGHRGPHKSLSMVVTATWPKKRKRTGARTR